MARKATETDQIDQLIDDDDVPIELEGGRDEFPSSKNALERYEKIRSDKKLFRHGTDFIRVFVFDDNTEDQDFGDPEHPAWVELESMNPEIDPPPAEKLYALIQEEMPAGGLAMVRFFRSKKRGKATEIHNPLFFGVAPSMGNSAWERQKYILNMKRQDRVEKEEMDIRKKAHEVELNSITRLFEMQQDEARRKAEQERELRILERQEQERAKEREVSMLKEVLNFQRDSMGKKEEPESTGVLAQLIAQMQQSTQQQTAMLAQLVGGGGGRSRYDDDDEERESQGTKFMALMMQNMQQQSAQSTQMLIAMMQTMVGLVQGQPKSDESKYVDLLQQNYSQNLALINGMNQKMLEIQTRRDNPISGLDSSLSDLTKNLKAIKNISETLGGGGSGDALPASAPDDGMWGAIGAIAEKVGPSLIDRFLGANAAPQAQQNELRSPTIPSPADQLYTPHQPQMLPQPQQPQAVLPPTPPQPQAQPQGESIGIFRLPMEQASRVEEAIVRDFGSEVEPSEFVDSIPPEMLSMIRHQFDRSEFLENITRYAQDDTLRQPECVEWLTEVRDLIY